MCAGAANPADLHEIAVGPYRLTIASGYGRRILGLTMGTSPQLLADLPDAVIDRPDSGVYHFRGGHRLWTAPDEPVVTYAPDDAPCTITERPGGVAVEGPPDNAGFVKLISVTALGAGLEVEHVLTNTRNGPIRVGAWAITQFPLGGTALLSLMPQAEPDSFQADRRLVLWPYTSLLDPRIKWSGAGLAIAASGGARLKFGGEPRPGKLGYLRDGWLFTKRILDEIAGEYADPGAVGQVFSDHTFCELESLGPLVELKPGASVTHWETWSVVECASLEEAWTILEEEPQ
jgi:hypothetical protein